MTSLLLHLYGVNKTRLYLLLSLPVALFASCLWLTGCGAGTFAVRPASTPGLGVLVLTSMDFGTTVTGMRYATITKMLTNTRT